jgi:regulator-associated protein of mTOR
MYYTDKRHETGGKPKPEDHANPTEEWRMRDRVKTVFAGLMLCLNIGVDPPDIVKTNPTATLECWIDPASPTSSASTKVMETIGKELQNQYETLSIRTRYKQYLDPSVEETKRCCATLRRNAREERVLLHYNGHGVPLPTASGEVWFFNRNYTQYIPVSLYDLQTWLAGPSIYVLDVSHAGNVIANFGRFVEKHEQENREALEYDKAAQVQTYSDNILLAACGKTEMLPTNPDLPADMFTSCLTTPVHISLRCFVLNSRIPLGITLKDLDKVPGRLQERRTPLGELNWIFTAITDTIAWNSLSRKDFRKLFRQDLMVAALFRNYLLAERLMKANNCTPETEPRLPPTNNHPLWQSWDLAIEMVLTQLPALIASENGGPHYEFQHSTFFAEQLTAFEVYLSQGAPEQKAPDQLPVVLQVLLSQVHRLRALILLSRFLDLGPWAVNLALSIGIFPYVLKLLQSAAPELKPVMIFIWTRILAVDQSCQTDLLKDTGYKYFISVLKPEAGIPVANVSEHRAMSAFIIAMFCKDFQQGQVVSLSIDLFQACLDHISDGENPLLRQWSCLCISMLWQDYPEAKWTGIRANAHYQLLQLIYDPVPEVRASALHALTNFLGIPDLTEQVAQIERSIASTVVNMSSDGNSMVRNELLVFFSHFVKRYEQKFLVSACEELVNERQLLRDAALQKETVKAPSTNSGGSNTAANIQDSSPRMQTSKHSIHASIWKHILVMTVDPHPEVARNAIVIADYVHMRLLDSVLGPHVYTVMKDIDQLGKQPTHSRHPSVNPLPRTAEIPTQALSPNVKKNEGYLSLGLKRTASVAAALKSLALGGLPAVDQSTATNSTSSGLNPNHMHRNSAALRAKLPDEWSRPPDAHDNALHSTAYQQAKQPMPRGYIEGEANEEFSVPLKSGFFDWSIEASFILCNSFVAALIVF